MKGFKIFLILIVVLLIAAAVWLYSGAYNVAADEPDSAALHWFMETIRERSIETRIEDIEVPPLDDPQLVASGAKHYDAMCVICHLAPGMDDTEIRVGLNPRPPNLAEHGEDPAEAFWVIKNGIKMTGMPAWGITHDDDSIWGLVAFVTELPEMSADEYRQLTGDAAGGHSHAGNGHDDAGSSRSATDAHPRVDGAESTGDDRDSTGATGGVSGPVRTVDRFFDALAAGRTDQAGALLAPDVLIFEGGGVERSREEYASNHMQSDAAFLGDAAHRLISRTESSEGELAWVATTARMTNTAGQEAVDINSTETMVLRKYGEDWRIQHIHWSSRPAGAD